MKTWRRVAIVAVGFVEALLFSGSLFGWPSLLYVLQKEDVYSHLCTHTTEMYKNFDGNTTSFLQKIRFNPALINSTNHQDAKEVTYEGLHLSYTNSPTSHLQNEIDKSITTIVKINERNGHIDDEDEEVPHSDFLRCTGVATNEMTKIYTVAAVAYGVTSILIGFSLDYFGLWVTRFLGSAMTTAGFLCLTFVSKETPWLLWPALNLIALGTNQLRLSCFQFANLWPQQKTTVIIAYSSAYSISTALFLLVQYAYQAEIAFKTIGMLLTGLSLFTFPITFLMPRFRIEMYTEAENIQDINIPDKKQNAKMLESQTKNDIFADKSSSEDKIYRPTAVDKVPLNISLMTLSACLHLLWHFINFFLVLFYSATFFQWAVKATNGTEKVPFYNQMSGLCAIIAPIFIPIAGFVTDWQIKRASLLEDKIEKLSLTMQAPAYTMAVATTFLISTMICKMFLTEAAIYTSIILISISRPFVVGSCTSYIRIRFHPDHFNRLNGIFTTIVSLLTLVQSQIVSWMFSSDESFLHANGLLLAILVLSLASPLHIFITPLARKYSKTHLKYQKNIL